MYKRQISGTVCDKNGENIIGASVLVKGNTNGTITDFDGNFGLRNVADNAILQISFVGYEKMCIRDRIDAICCILNIIKQHASRQRNKTGTKSIF